MVNSQPQVSDTSSTNTQQSREQIIADYEKQQADKVEQQRLEREQRAKELVEQRESLRVKRNYNFDNGVTRFQTYSEAHSSGVRGYHWIDNWKAADGNYYAEYAANRGDNKRYYSISEQKWYQDLGYYDSPSKLPCSDCGVEFMFFPASGFENKCPNCGKIRTDRFS